MHPDSASLSLLRREHPTDYLKAISLLAFWLTEQVNATNTLSVNQIADLSVRIGKKYYYLRLPEIMLCFYQAAEGRYGKDYNRLDAGRIMDWLERYDMEERNAAAEQQRQEQVKRLPATPALTVDDLRSYAKRVQPDFDVDFDQLTDEQRRRLQDAANVQAFYDRVAENKKTGNQNPVDTTHLRSKQRAALSDTDFQRYKAKYLAETAHIRGVVDAEHEDVTETQQVA